MRSADAAPAGATDPAGGNAAGDADAIVTWVVARDAVLRGLVHALSNRVGTVIAAGGLLEAGSAELAGRVLGGEADRLERLLEEFRLATTDPLDRAAASEPVVLADVVREAAALHAHAGDVRDTPVLLVGVDEAPPLLVVRAAWLHALLVLLPGAESARVTTVGDFVALRVEPAIDARAARAVGWLLRSSGARVDADRVVFVPRFGSGQR